MTSIIDFLNKFKDDKVCIDHFTKIRFANGEHCVLCGCEKVWKLKTKGDKQRYKCSRCNRIFNVMVNSFFENTKLPLNKWFITLFLLGTGSKGISSVQLGRQIGVTQKTAWMMLHKIRNSFPNYNKFFGDIEIDETYIGGKEINKHANKKIKGSQGGNNKEIVVGSIQREVYGNKKLVNARHIQDTKTKTLKKYIKKNIDIKANIISDDFKSYQSLSHYKVNHSAKEYVNNGIIHTNNIENFWSILKRGYIGIYHYWSKKYLQKYLDEYAFRFNFRSGYLNVILSNSKKLTWNMLVNG